MRQASIVKQSFVRNGFKTREIDLGRKICFEYFFFEIYVSV